MDLAKFTTEDTATMQLRDPVTGRPLVDEDSNEPITITLFGRDSKEFQAAARKSTSKRLNRRLTGRGGQLKMSPEEMEEDALGLLVAITHSWSHIVVDEKEWDCGSYNVSQLYDRFLWIKEQVDDFAHDRSEYLGNSSKHSVSSQGASSNSKPRAKVVTKEQSQPT